MLDPNDRYHLALGVLDREPDTHKILGDLLEESGERGLAQWARKCKGSRRKRLEFTLAVLPWRVVLWLGCEFLVPSVANDPDLLEDPPINTEHLDDEEFLKGIQDRTSRLSLTNSLGGFLQQLGRMRGIEELQLALAYARNIHPLGAQYEQLMRNQVRQVARLTSDRTHEWQLSRTREVIERMLDPERFP